MNEHDDNRITVRIEPLTEALLPSLHALFEAASCACFCRYWHFVGTKNDWLDRCAHHPEDNARELAEALRANHPSAHGLVALQEAVAGQPKKEAAVVGWMKLIARTHVPKLRALPVYRSLDLGDETTTLSVACMLVHPDARGKGVARALVQAAPSFARAWGTPGEARAIEAYPRRSSEVLHAEEVWQGPERVFIAAGFEVTHDATPYPVYRKTIPTEA